MRPDIILNAPKPAPNGGEVPAVVLDLDLADPLPAVPGVAADGRRVLRAWVLVRLFTEPLGAALIDVPPNGVRPAELGAALGDAVGSRLGGLPLPIDGYSPATEPPFLATRRAVLAAAPHITVVVCTRERPGALARCLDSLIAQQYPAFRVLVVDNAPITGTTAEVTRAAARRGPVEHLVEHRAGLSFARNAAVAAAPGQILAWIDDDAVADPHWLAEIARALDAYPKADVVSGVIVPAELESRTQLWFEMLNGVRDFELAVHRLGTARLHPYACGANMTFRPGVLERIGMFDTALGAGTPAMGAEDTQALTRVLLGGGTIVHQPTALTHQFHRHDLDGLRRHISGRSTGAVAAYLSLVLGKPSLLRSMPGALREIWRRDAPADVPRELLRAGRRGLLAGPGAYVKGRRTARTRDLRQKS